MTNKIGRVKASKIGRRKVKNASVLDFSSPDFFSPVLDFSPSPLTAPGSPRMRSYEHKDYTNAS